MGGENPRRSKLSASFHPHPDPPQLLLRTYVSAAASSARRRQHVAYFVDLNLSIRTSIDTSSALICAFNDNGNEKNWCSEEGGYAQTRKYTISVMLGEYNAIFDLMPTHMHSRAHTHLQD